MACQEQKSAAANEHMLRIWYAFAVQQCERPAASRWRRNQRKRRNGSGQSQTWVHGEGFLTSREGFSVPGSLLLPLTLQTCLLAGTERENLWLWGEDPTSQLWQTQTENVQTQQSCIRARREGVNRQPWKEFSFWRRFVYKITILCYRPTVIFILLSCLKKKNYTPLHVLCFVEQCGRVVCELAALTIPSSNFFLMYYNVCWLVYLYAKLNHLLSALQISERPGC